MILYNCQEESQIVEIHGNNMELKSKKILFKAESLVKQILRGEGSGHDWWHIYRVRKMAVAIAKEEKVSTLLIIELATLLHDIADRKLNKGDEKAGIIKVVGVLNSLRVDTITASEVIEIIKTMSFSHSLSPDGTRKKMKTIEGKIVQDADRLDAMGAIGIARAFAYGGHKGRELYNPNEKIHIAKTKKQYVLGTSHTINHFYEKLLLLKDLMNTKTATDIAKKRHIYMEQYLIQFFVEWEEKLI